MIKIVTAVFNYPGENEYTRCVNALEASAKDSNPNAELLILKIDPPQKCHRWNKEGWHNNNVKLKAYSEVEIDKPTFFIDADTIILKDLTDLIGSFDIAIAERPARAKAPFNLGVVLFMPTFRARSFMDAWIRVDNSMLNDINFHMTWREKYLGQNQSSFGYLYENTIANRPEFKKYPTEIMNACEQDWTNSEMSYIIHIKTRLRNVALSGIPLKKIKPGLQRPVKIWREYETKNNNSLSMV